MKGLLLRIGIDKGYGGCLAPVFDDNTFEYIPIPERKATTEEKVYANMEGKTGRKLVDFIPKKLRYAHPHKDPEFRTYTYGDPSKTKRSQLSKLENGDLLIFYAGLQKVHKKESHLYIIGYFTIDKVYDFSKITEQKYDSFFQKLKNNAHAKRYFKLKKIGINSEEQPVIVKGKPDKSKLLNKAIKISDNNDYMLEDFAPIFGYSGSLVRAVGHWIESENIKKVKEEILRL